MSFKIVVILGIVFVILMVLFLMMRRVSGRRSQKATTSRPVGGSARKGGQRRNWLVGESSRVKGKAYHIGSRTATLGRGVSNFVQVTDKDVSRVHCQFIPSPTGMQIKDLESGNGTLVNDEEVSPVRLLKDGDLIKAGNTTFRYHERGDFQDSALQAGKAVGARVSRPTELSGVQTVGEMARSALKSSGGDVEQAAASIGMEVDKFEWLCKSQNIDPEDFGS